MRRSRRNGSCAWRRCSRPREHPEAMAAYRGVLRKMPESLSAVRGTGPPGRGERRYGGPGRGAAARGGPDHGAGGGVGAAGAERLRVPGTRETIGEAAAGAADDLERALELWPDSAPAAEALSQTMQSTGRAERLVDVLSKAASAARDPERQAALWLAVAQVHEHRPNGSGAAVAALKRALKASADHVEAHRALARIYRANAQWSEAATALETLIRLGDHAGRTRRRSAGARRSSGTSGWRAREGTDRGALGPGARAGVPGGAPPASPSSSCAPARSTRRKRPHASSSKGQPTRRSAPATLVLLAAVARKRGNARGRRTGAHRRDRDRRRGGGGSGASSRGRPQAARAG